MNRIRRLYSHYIQTFDVKFEIFLLLLQIPIMASAQFDVQGVVTSTDNSPVPYANIIFTNDSSKLAAGAVGDLSGKFQLALRQGSYTLNVTSIGYENYSKQLTIGADTGMMKIVLQENTNQLKDVVISGRKPLIVRKIDRLVFNVEQNPIIFGGDAIDALKKSPGVIFKDGEFAMIGKSGMRVMINERLIELTGQELTSFLASIPVDRIKEIEIITNPSAKYDAQGNSGIVNIVTRKGLQNSWNNKTSYVYNQAYHSNHRLTNTFVYNKDKIGLVLGLNGKIGHTRIIKNSNIYYSSGTWSGKEYEKVNDANFAANLDINYQIDDKNSIGIKYLGAVVGPDASSKADTRVHNSSQSLDYILRNNAYNDRRLSNGSYNLHYERKLDTVGTSINANFDYFNYDASVLGDVMTRKIQAAQMGDLVFANNMTTSQDIGNYSFKIDVEQPIKFAKLSYGGKLSFISTNYLTKNYNTITGSPVFDPLQSNEFSYDENVQALYISGNKSLGSKWEVQFGLRLENTETKGVASQTNEINENKYLYLFPSFFLSHQLNIKNSFGVTYSRRLDRPNFGLLNPARTYYNSNAYKEGNPFLQPEIANNFELNHVYNDIFTTSVFLTRTGNGYGMVTNLDDQKNIQITTFKNYYRNYSYGLAETYSFKKDWLQSQFNVYLVNSESKFYEEVINAEIRNGFQFYFATNNTVSFNKKSGIKGQVDFMYTAPYNEGLYSLKQSYSLDLGLSFESLIKNWTLSMSVADIFNSSRNLATSTIDNVKQNFNVFPSNRYFRATVSYAFGNKNLKSKERNFGNDEEKKRSN